MKLSLNKILIIIIITLFVLILGITAGGFISKKAKPGKNLRTADPEPTVKELESLNKRSGDKLAAYTGIGRIRTVTASADSTGTQTADKDSGTGVTPIVITPWFSYEESNTELYEELSRKRILITGIITNYFSSRTEKELLSTSEEKIKNELLEEINSQLSLGKINAIYFLDYIFLK
ncbi:MAG: flagellar basal body-associated FliL family protein [Treponema sp.]|nr:flagellar basal body-associated FliL family protein [Treponema sp.]